VRRASGDEETVPARSTALSPPAQTVNSRSSTLNCSA
jgi:hypothetical protein